MNMLHVIAIRLNPIGDATGAFEGILTARCL